VKVLLRAFYIKYEKPVKNKVDLVATLCLLFMLFCSPRATHISFKYQDLSVKVLLPE